jgi:serine/threonine protein kinase
MGVRLLESEHGVGSRIDRYDLVAELASGGMATVYLARLSAVGGFHRTFAIKRLHPHLATNSDFVNMFLDEARLAALIRHPNVVPILEVGQGAEGYYLVMEYIEGDTFASVLSKTSSRGKRIPIGVTLRIVIDMLNGLHAAHELKDEHGRLLGLVHRDVSPQNVMVGTDGSTRITDFGVARAASALSQTKAGQLKGKLAYMAPEQANGADDVDRRVDVFAAGIVMWEALAFKRLFKASNEATTLSRVLTEPIVTPARHNPDVPEAVAAVCLRALERDMNKRFMSCTEFSAELERVAIASGQLASVKEVADYVEEIVGTDVESHRVAIRRWLEARERGATPLPSLPPPELSSVTMASRMPPRLSRGPAFSSSSALNPESATKSGVIPTARPARRRWPAAAIVFVGAAALAGWLTLSEDSQPIADAAVDERAVAPLQTAAPAAPTAASPTPPAPTDVRNVVLSEDLPQAPKDEAAPASAEQPNSGGSRRGGRRGGGAKKKAKLPDLDNPYQ